MIDQVNENMDIESLRVHADPIPPSTTSSIPPKLKNWYSHKSARILTCATLSMTIIMGSFISLYMNKASSCEVLGISSLIVGLWTPSPLGTLKLDK